jgi:hypothetical protein
VLRQRISRSFGSRDKRCVLDICLVSVRFNTEMVHIFKIKPNKILDQYMPELFKSNFTNKIRTGRFESLTTVSKDSTHMPAINLTHHKKINYVIILPN